MVIPWTPNLTISGYWPMKGEVDVRQLLYTLVECGCTIVLPMVAAKNKPLLFFHWLPGMSLTIGLHKTYHPLITNIALTPDLLIVPLLGFDRHGNRLGYGGGYYDRTITELRNKRTTVTVGIAYETQEISHIPHEQHDQRLDWIVTEKSIFKSLS
jgi:5-formyltetrahydrofolate cyclo-ligase